MVRKATKITLLTCAFSLLYSCHFSYIQPRRCLWEPFQSFDRWPCTSCSTTDSDHLAKLQPLCFGQLGSTRPWRSAHNTARLVTTDYDSCNPPVVFTLLSKLLPRQCSWGLGSTSIAIDQPSCCCGKTLLDFFSSFLPFLDEIAFFYLSLAHSYSLLPTLAVWNKTCLS